jgi:FMN phosphatase YigB (HAD superfamily)
MKGYSSLFSLIWDKCTKTKTLILDLDGTLYEDAKAGSYLKNEIPKLFYDHMTDKGLVESTGKGEFMQEYDRVLDTGISSTESILVALYNSFEAKEDLQDYLEWKDQNTLHLVDSIEESQPLSHSLKKAKEGYRVMLLTNHTKKYAEAALQNLGCYEHFEKNDIVTIDEVRIAKPSCQILDILASTYGVEISKSVFIVFRDSHGLPLSQQIMCQRCLPVFSNVHQQRSSPRLFLA